MESCCEKKFNNNTSTSYLRNYRNAKTNNTDVTNTNNSTNNRKNRQTLDRTEVPEFAKLIRFEFKRRCDSTTVSSSKEKEKSIHEIPLIPNHCNFSMSCLDDISQMSHQNFDQFFVIYSETENYHHRSV